MIQMKFAKLLGEKNKKIIKRNENKGLFRAFSSIL